MAAEPKAAAKQVPAASILEFHLGTSARERCIDEKFSTAPDL
jgi:hypothetical protein